MRIVSPVPKVGLVTTVTPVHEDGQDRVVAPVHEDGQDRVVAPVKPILNLPENVAGVSLGGPGTAVTHALSGGLDLPVTPAPLTLDLQDNVTHVCTDGFLRPVIRSVMDSAAVTMVTVRVVSRMVNGKEE